MVSIAESLNYRIFERKWRSGEASNGHPRACRIAQCRTKTQPTKESWLVSPRIRPRSNVWAHRDGGRVVTPNSTRHTVDSWVIHKSLYSRSLRRVEGLTALPPAQGARSTSETSNLHLLLTNFSFVTDLSAAGSPAELKHITQRRKRKQP